MVFITGQPRTTKRPICWARHKKAQHFARGQSFYFARATVWLFDTVDQPSS